MLENKDLEYILTCKKESRPKEDCIAKHFYDFYIVKTQEIDMKHIVLQESEVEAVKLASKEEFKQIVENGNVVDRKEIYDVLLNYLFSI